MNNAQKQEILSNVKINLEDFLFNTFIDLPQTLGAPINEMHDDILSCLLTEIAKTHNGFYIEEEEEESASEIIADPPLTSIGVMMVRKMIEEYERKTER